MSIGLGIFLSSLVIAFTLLFINVRKNTEEVESSGAKFPNLFNKYVVLLALVSCGALVAYFGLTLIPKEIGKLTAVTEFAGVKFGSTKEQILYELEKPTKTSNPIGGLSIPPEFNDSRVFDKSKNEWYYDKNDYSLMIYFDAETQKVNKISCYYAQEFIPLGVKHCKLKNIGLGASEEQVIENLGEASSSSFSESGNKYMDYEQLKTRLGLNRKVVLSISVEASK
jgi:hypothetical protein